IRSRLTEFGLSTGPDFASGHLDELVSIQLLESREAEQHKRDSTRTASHEDSAPTNDVSPTEELLVQNIPAATGGVLSVTPEHSLDKAQSEMQANDYSQLAVMTGPRALVGTISWESIAKAQILQKGDTVLACMDPRPALVYAERPLLDIVPQVYSKGYVFVRDHTNVVVGIVTSADLAYQFALLTKPFLLVGEIERIVRQAVDRVFSVDDLFSVVPPDYDKEILGAQSLTLGQLQRLVEGAFARLGWRADRKIVIRELDAIREIRNDVTHFSPDPVSDEDVVRLERVLAWFRDLESSPADLADTTSSKPTMT
ncbi:MAG: hypothetical protein DWP92_10375, partial [Armatimonadetes bacterium]